MIIDLLWNLREKILNLPQSKIVYEKSTGNFDIDTDFEINKYLTEELRKICDVQVISEHSNIESNGSYWIIDPIDGSSNKILGFPYSTTIAWKDKELGIIFGAIYDYEKDEIYYASKGEGSFKLDREGNKIKIEMPKVSGTLPIIFGIPYDRSRLPELFTILQKLLEYFPDAKRIGSASLDVLRVLNGNSSMYFELNLNIWDIGAASLILEEAGGYHIKEGDIDFFCVNKEVYDQVKFLLKENLI